MSARPRGYPGRHECLRHVTAPEHYEKWRLAAAIEGFRYRPNTTALEAQRIGLELIRSAVGEDVLPDGSPMLASVGLVDAGRISADTRHAFATTRVVEPGIAARFLSSRDFAG
ncbi:hypothetical protein SBA4_3730021 [Candidatus Sulfopaludibacter sp. SbA4]|nr:hypothetical protein SBA4_3730021 [Candidatus Sulfopaludibacter sp. SbA4]